MSPPAPTGTTDLPAPADVVAWWVGLGPARWFVKDLSLDEEIRQRFGAAHAAAAAGRLAAWEETPEGALALLLLLDQFPRNMFRGSAEAFATDAPALAIAIRAIDRGFDRAFANPVRRFFYLPYMHSEDLADQERCIALCRDADDPEGVHHAEVHADIIRRFGRFPHRNPMLGRTTTPEEQAFLDAGGFAG
ncbi:DUF924 family protein [Rhodoplanes sp. TEM]|uniref:DUF924 family protein n=1 Tax=Rhodoplanes tepidamans TaxID=200616 RepID=A0ABT5J8Q3_RHOTP|nr:MULTISPECIES: DUF924 family protein [Rhodoplanes]MDC7785978.1 DUF924 family protein [Rhodoplanes tepidamans]MDC7987023.1 DUF924 family protein [Rhodoplanes sp. TEM]MDQ0357055.1 uncharacterized protein (DUF924 family) [Rhodoplanes tepidamans]